MKFTAVIDIAAFIWDEHQFNADQTQFYPLIESIPNILSLIIKEKIPVAFRSELFLEIKGNFPYKLIPKQFNDFRTNTISQLTKLNVIDYPNSQAIKLTCDPPLIREYFDETTQLELNHLVDYLYSEDERVQKLLTFSVFWQLDQNMKIKNGKSKEIKTEICDNKSDHQKITNGLKKIFKHNPKHQLEKRIVNGKSASALRCYNSGTKNTTKAQKILDSSYFVEGSFYGYDDEHRTYVKFVKTTGNIFHGYEINPDSKLEEKIKTAAEND